MAKIAKVFKFSITELLFLLEAWFVFLKWDLLISFTQYKRWRTSIGDLSAPEKSVKKLDNTFLAQIKVIIKLSEIAGRFHFRKMNCLRRCLSQKQMLTKRGFNTLMHIGVSIEEGKVKAHAWLTFQGNIINDNDNVLSRYTELNVANEHAILSSLQ